MPGRQLRMFPIPTRRNAALLELLPDPPAVVLCSGFGHYVPKRQLAQAEALVKNGWAVWVSAQHFARTPDGRAALKNYQRELLPPGVLVVTATGKPCQVVLDGRNLGELTRSGASRGSSPVWFAAVEQRPLAGSFPTRTAAAREVCKAHGMHLPGEN